MRDRQDVALALWPAVWPPDDTEESVVGPNLHQTTIINLRTGLNEAAALATPEGAPLLWQAGGQTMISGFQHPDGSPYTALPDVFVYRHPLDDRRGSLGIALDGPPLLILEVLSDTTHENDLDLTKGKGYSYRVAGVREYLTLDPTGAYLTERGRGWRLEGTVYRPWQREPDGRWHSRGLPLAFGLEGVQVAVFTAEGHRLLREGEVERTLREQRLAFEARERRAAEELAHLRRRLEELERGR